MYYKIKDVVKGLEALELPILSQFFNHDFPNQETITAQQLSDWCFRESGGWNFFRRLQCEVIGYIPLEQAS